MKIIKYMLICLHLLLFSCGIYIIFTEITSRNTKVILCFVISLLLLLNGGTYLYFRKRFTNFSDEICNYTENILHGNPVEKLYNKETLTSKMVMELEKVESIVFSQLSESKKEKKEIQKMISEITHQIKTPVSNIKMYCEMFDQPDISLAEAQKSVQIIKQQLIKLEFLLEALIKSSRLEGEMIRLEMENSKIIETLAVAVNNVIQKADSKHIDMSVECRPYVQVRHDMKWTAEAIENILDNAIKYTNENGKIAIAVNTSEMYTEIKVTDTGKGIAAAHRNDIFKRFYREKTAAKTEGLGLGLYLARQIIHLQGGYISVRSEEGCGSCFSICLPNKS